MFTEILTALLTSYKISLSPKDFTRFEMNKDDEEKMQKAWEQYEEYLSSEYSYDDFFQEELWEKQEAYPNRLCDKCNSQTFTLVTYDKSRIFSKCPKCKHSHIIHN